MCLTAASEEMSMSIRVLQITRCKKRKPFGCRHTRVRWAAEYGHLSFDTEENLLNRLDLLFGWPFPLRTFGSWFFLW